MQRAVDLRSEDAVDALRRLRRHDAVVERAGDVEHAAQIGERLQQSAYRFAVGDVAGDDLHCRTGRLQLARQRLRTRRRAPLPRRQHQLAYAVARHDMSRHARAQRPRAAGDQHRAALERRLSLRSWAARSRQSRHQELSLAQRQLRLRRRQRRRQHLFVAAK